MAENQEDRSSEDLTDQESPYRLEEFRRKGQVAQSKELTGMLALLATGTTVYVMAPSIAQQVAEFMREIFRADIAARADLGDARYLGGLLMRTLKLVISLSLPICLAGFFLGIGGSFGQIGSVFSTDPLQPDLDKINPLKGLQRILSLKHLSESLLMAGKAAVIAAVAYFAIRSEVLSSPQMLMNDPVSLFAAMGVAGKGIFLPMIGILLVFSLADFWMVKRDYSKQLRLTKQEAKQEFKEREGDPQLKARVRAVQREVARRRMMQAVRKADVIITNPTHIAIAIVYDKETMMAPKVVAKGADHLAQRIKKVAADAGVPLVENVPLARTLYKSVKTGQLIPRALYQAVAEVLAYVYRLKGRGF